MSKLSDILTTLENNTLRPGAVTVVLTGARPEIEAHDAAKVRYAALDGRLTDLDSDRPADLMPMISDDWTKHFHWNGTGQFPADERAKLEGIVKKAHEAHRVVRFWKTPEKEAVWRELRSAGVDLINTDQLARLAVFLKRHDAVASGH
jgi:glycerophosphoryl diester phosphodiesterase